MGAYESSPIAVQSDQDKDEEKIPSGYFGVTVSGEQYEKNLEVERSIQDALEKAFEQGKRDGIKSSGEMIAHIVDTETTKMRHDMAVLNSKYKDKAKQVVCFRIVKKI